MQKKIDEALKECIRREAQDEFFHSFGKGARSHTYDRDRDYPAGATLEIAGTVPGETFRIDVTDVKLAID